MLQVAQEMLCRGDEQCHSEAVPSSLGLLVFNQLMIHPVTGCANWTHTVPENKTMSTAPKPATGHLPCAHACTNGLWGWELPNPGAVLQAEHPQPHSPNLKCSQTLNFTTAG